MEIRLWWWWHWVEGGGSFPASSTPSPPFPAPWQQQDQHTSTLASPSLPHPYYIFTLPQSPLSFRAGGGGRGRERKENLFDKLHILLLFCLIWILLFPLPYYTKCERLPRTKNCVIVIANRRTLAGCFPLGLDKWLLENGVNSVYKRIQRMLTYVTSHGSHQPYVTLTTSGNWNRN